VVLQDQDGMGGNIEQFSLMVDRPDDESGESWILMRSETFSMNRSPTMMLGNREFLMLPVGLVEKGTDFDLVCYRKMTYDDGVEGES
jgi:hypothetical protein